MSAPDNSTSTPSSARLGSSGSSLVTIVLDVSPLAYGEREIKRTALDKIRFAANKPSAGPVILSEVLESVIAFVSAAKSIEKNAIILVVAVADRESALVFPRKDVLEKFWSGAASSSNSIFSTTDDAKRIQGDIMMGVTEILELAATKAAKNTDPANRQASIAAACSKALCIMNRCFVAASTGRGISALHSVTSRTSEPIVAMAPGAEKRPSQSRGSTWSPRILVIQASPDKSRDYNALMNCAFCAAKQNIVIDGCFLASSGYPSSSFLEQTCDLTGGIFLAPSGMSQINGALTEVLVSVFLAPLSCRSRLHLPALHRVEFKARCFDTDNAVDIAVVCNQCLSIYENTPTTPECPTCHAKILRRENDA